ncbi:hypothetical protein PR002_g8385 [Phytophthora rubi]|uniref:Uncharacterized protein n=1 Tax=Phytophthora rubi TaxID=129364 RepID=A0A6A3MXR0_9STRA|nr:hypothetical protein PR002_g8385 [Phytophthora rubi]
MPADSSGQRDILGHHRTGLSERYYNQQVEGWWGEDPTLKHAMQRLLHIFARKINPAQSMTMFTAQKSAKRSWTEHFLYLSTEIELRGKQLGRDNVNDVHEGRVGTPKRFKYGKQGHLKASPMKKKEWGQGADYMLAVGNATPVKGLLILDSGSSRHLVNDVSLLENPEDF